MFMMARADESPSLVAARQAAAEARDDVRTLAEREYSRGKLEEAARLFIAAGSSVEAAETLNRLGRLQLILNLPDEALESHQTALKLLEQQSEVIPRINNLNGLGAVYLRLDKRTEAKDVINNALKLSEEASYKIGEAEALLELSESLNHENHVVAVETAQRALAIWQALNDKPGIARSYSHIGQYYMAQNALIESTQNYQSSLQLWQELQNPAEQSEVLIMLGYIEHRKGDWQAAISYMTQAQSLIDDKSDPVKMGQATTGIAEAMNESGMPETALLYLQSTLKYYEQMKDPNFIAYAHWDIGNTYHLLGEYDLAISHQEQALALIDADSIQAAQCHESWAKTLLAQAKPAEAFRHLELSLATYSRTTNYREAAQARALQARALQQQGDSAAARDVYSEALEGFRKLSDRVNEAAVSFELGKLEIEKGRYDSAEKYLLDSITLTENIRRATTSSDLATAFSATIYERYGAYVDCLMHKSQQGTGNNFAIKAFEANELARGRSLAEMLKATGTNLLPGLDADLAAQEKSLRQRLRSKEDLKIRLLTNGAKKEELDALEQEVAKLEDEYKQLSDVIKARFPAFDEITRPHGWDLKRIQQQVIADDQTLLLEYNLGEKSSYAWTVTRDGFASYELPGGAKQINDAAQRVYELLQSGDTKQNEWEQATAALSKMVLLPVKNSLNKQRIIVVADGALNYIPFQSLPPSPNNSEPLVAKFEVVNAPSASVLGQLRQETDRRQQRPQLLAAYGDAAFPSDFAQRKESNGDHIASLQAAPTDRWRHALRDIELKGDKFDPSSLQRLVYAELEVNNLRKVTGAGSLIATGFDASREKLLSTDLTRFSILHFATHGIFDPKRPEYSGLFLSMIDRDGKDQNGFLGLQDIYNLHAPVDLVVLSACRTGLGKDVRGEGLIGLTRGFMYAGASSVVASLWKVDDEATAELMKEFYTNMVVRQLTPAASLREAQNTIRKRPEWSSPHFWAAFTIQGEYNKVIKPAPSSHFPIYVATLSVLILGSSALLYYRRKRTARDRYSTVKK